MGENDELAQRSSGGLAGDVRESVLAALPGLLLAVFAFDPSISLKVLTTLRLTATVVAGRNALRGRVATRRVEALERRVSRNEKRLFDLRRQLAASPLVVARVQALEEQVIDVAREAAARGATADQVRDALTRPDIVFLLAMARDHYAVATMRERLRRHAAVIAGRVGADAAAPFDRTLLFARAALELEAVAVEFLAMLATRRSAEESDLPQSSPANTPPTRSGETKISRLVDARSWPTAEDADAAVVAIERLTDLGFAVDVNPSIRRVGLHTVPCSDGSVAGTSNPILQPTALGLAFVDAIVRESKSDR